VLLRWQRFMAFSAPAQAELLPTLLADRDAAGFLGLHSSGGFQWFIRERWELLLELLALVSLAAAAGDGRTRKDAGTAAAKQRLLKSAAAAGYRLDRLLAGGAC